MIWAQEGRRILNTWSQLLDSIVLLYISGMWDGQLEKVDFRPLVHSFILTKKQRAYGCTNYLGKGLYHSHILELRLCSLYQGAVPANVAV
jgi:hypothetical protein